MPDSEVLEHYRGLLEAMEAVHGSGALRAAAEQVLEQLPSGGMTLVATSIEGAAIAASCAAMSPRKGLTWRFVNLISQPDFSEPVVVVEPTDPGSGWRSDVLTRLPQATFIFPLSHSQAV